MRLVSGDPRMLVDAIPGGGYSIRLANDETITAKITGNFTLGGYTFYTWEEVRPRVNGSGYDTLPGGRVGDNVAAYAHELNGATSVANDTIVVLRFRLFADTSTLSGAGEVVALYEFDRCFTPTPVSGSFPSGSVSGSDSGSVSGSISGSDSGSIDSGSVSGSVSGSIDSGSVSGAVSGSVDSGASGASGASGVSGSVSGGSGPCDQSGILTIEVVTNVECIDGSIVVTKTTIGIPGGVLC